MIHFGETKMTKKSIGERIINFLIHENLVKPDSYANVIVWDEQAYERLTKFVQTLYQAQCQCDYPIEAASNMGVCKKCGGSIN